MSYLAQEEEQTYQDMRETFTIHQTPRLALFRDILAVRPILILPFDLFFPSANDGRVEIGNLEQVAGERVADDFSSGCSYDFSLVRLTIFSKFISTNAWGRA
jgi:hypothetical protein